MRFSPIMSLMCWNKRRKTQESVPDWDLTNVESQESWSSEWYRLDVIIFMNTEIYYSLSYLLLCCFVLLFLAFLHHLTFSFFILFCSDTYLWSSTTSLGLKNKSILKVIKINRVVNNIKIAFFFFFRLVVFCTASLPPCYNIYREETYKLSKRWP